MSDNDLIRRGDALAALKAANLPFGYGQAAHAIANVPAVPVAVKWEHIQTAPRGGEWFIARTAYGTTRVAHYADEYDRYPISHDNAIWETSPIEWTPLNAALSALTITPAPDAVQEAAIDIAAIENGGKRWHGEDHRVVAVRWEPYKPDGQRQMKAKGRWQEQVGSGDYWRWQNCDRPAAIAALRAQLAGVRAELAFVTENRNKWQDTATRRWFRAEEANVRADRAEAAMAAQIEAAIREIWGLCEDAEDEAHEKLKLKLTEHERGFWAAQKMTAKRIRRATQMPTNDRTALDRMLAAAPAPVAPSLRITGPNSDGEYWLHIKAGGRSGGVNLGGERGPICKQLLDAASETGAKE